MKKKIATISVLLVLLGSMEWVPISKATVSPVPGIKTVPYAKLTQATESNHIGSTRVISGHGMGLNLKGNSKSSARNTDDILLSAVGTDV